MSPVPGRAGDSSLLRLPPLLPRRRARTRACHAWYGGGGHRDQLMGRRVQPTPSQRPTRDQLVPGHVKGQGHENRRGPTAGGGPAAAVLLASRHTPGC